MSTLADRPKTAAAAEDATYDSAGASSSPRDTALFDSEKGEDHEEKAEPEEEDFATGLRLIILMAAILLCQFLVALDMVRRENLPENHPHPRPGWIDVARSTTYLSAYLPARYWSKRRRAVPLGPDCLPSCRALRRR